MSAMPSETPATFDMIRNSSVFLEMRVRSRPANPAMELAMLVF
jgi:hypothetical protein